MTSPFPLPEGVRYDGPMEGLPKVLQLFTDLQTDSSFAVQGIAPSVEQIAQERDAIRRGYAEAEKAQPADLGHLLDFLSAAQRPVEHEPIRPLFVQEPRVYAAPEINHFK